MYPKSHAECGDSFLDGTLNDYSAWNESWFECKT